MPRLNYSGLLSPKAKSQNCQNRPNPDTSSAQDLNSWQTSQEEEQATQENPYPDDKKEQSLANLIKKHPWAAIGLGFVVGGIFGRNVKRRYQARALKLTQHQ